MLVSFAERRRPSNDGGGSRYSSNPKANRRKSSDYEQERTRQVASPGNGNMIVSFGRRASDGSRSSKASCTSSRASAKQGSRGSRSDKMQQRATVASSSRRHHTQSSSSSTSRRKSSSRKQTSPAPEVDVASSSSRRDRRATATSVDQRPRLCKSSSSRKTIQHCQNGVIVEFPQNRSRRSAGSTTKMQKEKLSTSLGNLFNDSWRVGSGESSSDKKCLNRSLGDILSDSWRGGGLSSQEEKTNGKVKKSRPQFVPPKTTHEDDCMIQQQQKQRKSRQQWKDAAPPSSKKIHQDHKKCLSRSLNHSRRFQDTNDWRNSSIDWGDDGLMSDEDEDDNNCNGGIDKSWKPDPVGTRRGSWGSKVSQRRFTDLTDSTETAETQSSSLSHSLTSLIGIRKIDP